MTQFDWLKEPSCSVAQNSNPYIEKRRLACFNRSASLVFAKRNSPRLRLAVAKYGAHIQTLRRIFKQGTEIERLAVLSNVLIGPEKSPQVRVRRRYILDESEANGILNFRSNWSGRFASRAFAVFSRNPNIRRDWLADTIKNWVNINDFEGDGLLHRLVGHLYNSPTILSTPDDDDDLYDEMTMTSPLNYALTDLLQKVPVTSYWACMLQCILPKLYLPQRPNFEVDLLDRWKDPEPTDETTMFSLLREQIIKCLRWYTEGIHTLDHPDAVVRRALYRSLPVDELFAGISRGRDFCYPSPDEDEDESDRTEPQQAIVDFCKKHYKRDEKDFVENLIENVHFWKRKEEREFLRNLVSYFWCGDHSYDNCEANYLKTHPSWFKDDDSVDIPFENPVDEKLSRLQSEVNKIRDVIEETQSLTKQQHNLIIEQIQSQILRLSNKLKGTFWILVIVIGAILYFKPY